MARRLAPAVGGRLVTYVGYGHSWLLNGSANICMQDVVSSYLIEGVLPAPGPAAPPQVVSEAATLIHDVHCHLLHERPMIVGESGRCEEGRVQPLGAKSNSWKRTPG